MKDTTKQYGLDVVEFFKFDQAEFDALLEEAMATYTHGVESLLNKRKAANISFVREPLVIALDELHKKFLAGYKIHRDRYCGVKGISLDLVLIKPAEMQEAEIAELTKEVEEQYLAQLWQRNVDETNRQIAITLERKAREVEAKKAAAETAAAEKAHAAALKDLLDAYAK
ncbi:hypothetical protein [Metapseudomonas sp. CR1201]